jgi:hypothetical protein
MSEKFSMLHYIMKYFFNHRLNEDRDIFETLSIAIKFCLEHTSPDTHILQDEIAQYLKRYGDNVETMFRKDYPDAFDPALFGLSVKSFLEKIITAIQALPEDYFPHIDNLVVAGLNQDVSCYGDTLEEWLDFYWEQFDVKDFVKLKKEIFKYIQYHGSNIEHAYQKKYKNEFNPNNGILSMTVIAFFEKIIAIIDVRLKQLESGA